ncbi:MAG TPA: hypothetical protein VGM23_09275 [Armatimonadota bacterium]
MDSLLSLQPVTSTWIELSPEVRIELLRQADRLLGLGAVTVGGVPIRTNAVPIRPDFSTPDGLHYQDFLWQGMEQEGDSIVLHSVALGRQEVFGEMMDEYSYNLAFPRLREIQRDQLDWVLTPRELTLDTETYHGFSLGFRFSSEHNEIHKVTTVATWEIGGHAAGNTVYHQAYSCQPVYEATVENHFSSTCLKQLDLWNSWLGHSYQMLPRWGCIQPYDFQASAQGVLLGYWPDPHSVKSLLQKNPGEDVLFVLDEYDFALTKEIVTPAKHILFSPSPTAGESRPRHEVVNMWTRAMEHSTEIIRGFFGIKNCEPRLSGGPHYHGRNSVPREELANGRQPDWLWQIEDGKFYFLLEGEKIESRDFLYWVGDTVLPRLQERGYQHVWFEPVHESDFTEGCFDFHAQTGWHSDLVVTSICGTRRYVPSQFYDGWRGWNYLAARAKDLGMSLGHWVGLHLTPRAPILQEHPDYLLQHVNTLGHGGGYSHQFISSINFCSGARQWFLDDLRRWHDEGGLEWLFFDSWPNLGCSPLNYGGRMEPMQWVLGEVLAELQQIGYDWFSFEGTSPFGVHQYGLWDPMADYSKHTSQGVLGQNDFGTWVGHEYMGFNQTLGPNINPQRERATIPEMSFRYAANRSLTLVVEDHNNRYPYSKGLDDIYAALHPLMRQRYLLPNDQGVCWRAGNGQQALFAYQAFAYPLPAGAGAWQVHGKTETPVKCPGGVLTTQPWTAYRIG